MVKRVNVKFYGYDVFEESSYQDLSAHKFVPIEYNKNTVITIGASDLLYVDISPSTQSTLRVIYYSAKTKEGWFSSAYAFNNFISYGDTKEFKIQAGKINGNDIKDIDVFILPIDQNWNALSSITGWTDPYPNRVKNIRHNDDLNNIYNTKIRPQPKDVNLTLDIKHCTSSRDFTIPSIKGCTLAAEMVSPDGDNPKGYYFGWNGPDVDITFTADKGYEFSQSYTVYDGDNASARTPNGLTSFTDSYLCTQDSYYIQLEATRAVSTTSALSRIYKVTDNELMKISGERYVSNDDGSTIDLSQYITGLYLMFLPVEEENLIPDSNIYLGPVKLQTTSTQIDSDRISYYLGEIQLPEKTSSSYDYNNVKVTLHSPFFNDIDINPQYVVGNSFSISYELNLRNGLCYIYLFSNKLKEIFYSESEKIVEDIPYYLASSSQNVNYVSNQINKATFKPFVIVERDKPLNGLQSTTKDVKIGDVTGFNSFENVKLLTNASLSEQQQIESYLENGVYINE